MRLPNSAQTSRPWRIHEIVPDFRLEDVWALPTPGGPPGSRPRCAPRGPDVPPGGWVVLYDFDCGFCKWLLAILLRWDRAALLRPLALQRPEADDLLADLEPAARRRSWHLVSPAGGRRSGGDAVPPLLRLLPGGRLPAAAFGRFPGATERGYRWVAEHRSGLSRLVPRPAKQRAADRVRQRERSP